MRLAYALAVTAFVVSPLSAQSPCKLEGVWQLVSGSADGKAYPGGASQIKIITKRHFAFLVQEPGGPKEMKTSADSLAAFRHAFAGGGTYTLQGTTYTERLEYFTDPAYVGMMLPFTCRTDGDRFYQTGTIPIFEGGKKVHDRKLEEVWRRVE